MGIGRMTKFAGKGEFSQTGLWASSSLPTVTGVELGWDLGLVVQLVALAVAKLAKEWSNSEGAKIEFRQGGRSGS
ncbi:hypothetical protein PanWU01x14_047820 [Parasponia andersonii]|uniref:Uncharacterized protein n=1 Tax=Parasponia andersonii TaxID=3476 RepID=A0A2P5DN63_PARAD|nr:hypothetical protein PanWU01x14_047820 [Parasponia andersonii]